MRVLIVDPCERFRTTMRRVFAASGFCAVGAPNFTAASAPLRKKRFVLVVAQLSRNATRNVAVVMAVQTQTATPILFVGQRGLPELPDKFEGAAEAIVAPFDLEKLIERAASLIARYRDLAQLQAALAHQGRERR